MSETKRIEDGRRLKAFLEDEAVKGAFIELEKRYFAEFKDAKTPHDREALHARCRALADLFETVLGTVNSGKIEEHYREQRQLNDTAKRTPRSR